MICEKCSKREATVHLTETIKSAKSEYHLCEVCAKNVSLNLRLGNYSDSLRDILSFFDDEKILTDDINKACPNCGMTSSEFAMEFKAGCPCCYGRFRESLELIIPPAARHAGKKPSNYAEIDFDAEPERAVEVMEHEDVTMTKADELKEKLEIAVSEERYEDAAKLRDMVRELERVV